MKKIFSWLWTVLWAVILFFGAAVAVVLGLEREKSVNEKISKIESEAKNDVEKIGDNIAQTNYLNDVLKLRRNTRT